MTQARTVLITGGSSGIGRALALWFAKRGARVFAAARRKDALNALAQEAAAAGATVEPVVLDVADADAVLSTVQRLDEESGGLDVVVANAGVGGETYAKRLHWPTLEQQIRVNVTGAAATLTAALPGMVRRGKGQLAGISSLAAFRGMPRSAGYCASKAYLATFLEGLRNDLAGTGVGVTCVFPGFVRSELTAKNSHKMPFLMEPEAAAEKIGKALLKGSRNLSFPWQLAATAHTSRLLPGPIYEAASRRLR